MNRTSSIGAAAATACLVLSPLTAASGGVAAPAQSSTGWRILDDYASPSGDVYTFVRAKRSRIQLGLNSFVDFGKVNICVKKRGTRTWVCVKRDLKPGRHDLFTARVRWQGNYPTKGSATRVVRFLKGAPKLSFRP